MNIIYPDKLTKYNGGITEKDKYYQYLNKTNNNTYYKNFYFKKYKNKENALKAAEKYMKQYCINNKQVLNKYIKKTPNCFIVYLNRDDYMIVCKEQLDLVNNFNWRLQNKITYATNEDLIPFHELAFNSKYIIHKNGNKLDNRPENIEKVTEEQFIWYNTHKNRDMRQDNNSGCTGVCKVTVGKYEYWEVRGKNYQGRKILKRFSVKKLGNLGAKSQAIEFRKENIDNTY